MKKIPLIMLVSSICILVVGMCCYVVGGQRFAHVEEHSNVYVKFIKMEVLSEKVYCTRIIGKGIAEIYMKEPLVGFEFRRHSKDELELILHYQSSITSMLYTDCPEGEENNITISEFVMERHCYRYFFGYVGEWNHNKVQNTDIYARIEEMFGKNVWYGPREFCLNVQQGLDPLQFEGFTKSVVISFHRPLTDGEIEDLCNLIGEYIC